MLIAESIYPFLNEDFLAEQVLNEKFDLNSIKDKAKKLGILASLFLLTASNHGIKDLPSKEEVANSKPLIYLAQQPYVSQDDIQRQFDKMINLYFWEEQEPEINWDILQDPLNFRTSKEGMDFIKEHEKLRLEGYEIGDGMVTIGYGHAEPVGTSQYAVGQKITEYEAEKLFKKDIKKFEEGVRDLFAMWAGRGLDVKISQHMWDSMISMAYNMGVNGLRGSEIVLALRDKDYIQAADSITTANVSSKFPGLEPRREAEKQLFLKGLLGDSG